MDLVTSHQLRLLAHMARLIRPLRRKLLSAPSRKKLLDCLRLPFENNSVPGRMSSGLVRLPMVPDAEYPTPRCFSLKACSFRLRVRGISLGARFRIDRKRDAQQLLTADSFFVHINGIPICADRVRA